MKKLFYCSLVLMSSVLIAQEVISKKPKLNQSRKVSQEEAEATSTATVETPTSKQNVLGQQIQIGLESASWKYTEFSDGQRFMQDKGRLNGAFISVQNVVGDDRDILIRGKASYLSGKTTYNGGLSDDNGNTEPLTMKSKNSILHLQGDIGLVYSLSENSYLSPFTGLSIRQLTNDEDKSVPYDYTREASYTTLPLGLSLDGIVGNGILIGLSARYHYLLDASTKSRLSDVPGLEKVGTVENIQDKGKGSEVNGYATFKVSEKNSLKINAYYQTWDFADSRPVRAGGYQFVEPKNETQMTGLNLSLGF